jgi:hypothetical protein
VKPAVQKERFRNEKHYGEDRPHDEHQMHPPKRWVGKAIPRSKALGHIEARQSSD